MLRPPLEHIPLGLQQNLVALLQNDLAPGQRHLVDGYLRGGGPRPGQMAAGDLVGLVDVDIVVVVGLKADLRDGSGHLLQILPHPLGQEGLVHHPVLPEVVQGRAVGQHHRRVDGGAAGMRGKGGVGSSGGHRKGPPLPGEVVQGGQVGGGHLHILPIKGVVKVADQQNTVKLSDGSRLPSELN